jgi:RNA-dependent RNA polymerase
MTNSKVLGIIATNWLIIADQSELGIIDPDCLTLARLHSDAVDYPKSGQPVLIDKIPKLKFRAKPDWDAPETAKRDSTAYYESRRALGRLSRAIDLPALTIVRRAERTQHRQLRTQREETLEDLEDLLENLHLNGDIDDPVYIAVETRVAEFISIDPNHDLIQDISYLYYRYTSELHTICIAHTLAPQRNAMLTEEEAVIGTIVGKTSQPRLRKDMMGKMRELTDRLVREIREDIAGEDDTTLESPLERAWAAWQLSVAKSESFGARSFGWIALGVIFEAVKDIEEALR